MAIPDCGKPGDDFQGIAVQMDDADAAFPFGFLLRDHDARGFEVDVPGFDLACLLRAATAGPGEQDQVPEGIAFGVMADDPGEVFRGDVIVASSGLPEM